jgi:hypothetical protein
MKDLIPRNIDLGQKTTVIGRLVTDEKRESS